MNHTGALVPALSLLLAGGLLGCTGGEGSDMSDGGDGNMACPLAPAPATPPMAMECWEGGGTPTEGVDVLLGSSLGEAQLVEPEQDLVLYRGIQGGVHFYLNARIRGMIPGDPKDAEAANPFSLFSVYTESGERANLISCAFHIGYEQHEDCAYELSFSRAIQLDNAFKEILFGQRVRIRAEILDAEGRYGMAERWVRVVEQYPAPDAGIDAGPDAADDAGPDAASDAGMDAALF